MFQNFSKAVKARYDEMAKRELFVVDVEDIYTSYLAAFPDGTNPIFRTNTQHDCNCCKQFIRKLGVLVAIDDAGQIMTVWDDANVPAPYDVVTKQLADIVRQAPILRVFRAKEAKFGQAYSYDTHDNRRWDHFVGEVHRRHHSDKPGEAIGGLTADAQVFRRGLEELTSDALTTIADLIESNSLYRGEEHKRPLEAFRATHTAYSNTPNKELFAWANLNNPAARFRNTVMGTLAVDLSNGVELDKAVRSFEAKVAPTNYKRTTALITPRMIEQAVETLRGLDLEGAVERRFARVEDVSVNNVLFVDNTVASRMKDSLTDMLMASAAPVAVSLDKAKPITAQEFFDNIVPKASSIEMLVENTHLGNFASLTAPAHDNTGRLFKWDNDFAWSYDGDVADSIKERVKQAGGNVTDAELRVSLAWWNYDDLDIHAYIPKGGHIYYGNPLGVLDVDMNAGAGRSRTPVENLSWRKSNLVDGVYRIEVNQFSRRETIDTGFTIEIETNGRIEQISYDKPVTRTVPVATITVKNGVVTKIDLADGLSSTSRSVQKWGVNTQQLVPVDTIMLSPNHWDGQGVGNRHWFFMLRDCKNPGETRGIYNEFLRGDLESHRKVFEVLGARAKCPPSEAQLSGLGFSSTRGDKVKVIVKGASLNGAFEVQF